MSILIHKDDKQLGPYNLEEARALVLSGELSANDWAWPDNATQWIKLKDVAGFSSTAPAAAPAPADVPPAPPNTEQELWSGHPSQLLNFKVYFVWAVLIAASLGSVAFVPMAEAALGVAVLAAIALLHCLICYFRILTIAYVVTSQRIRVVSGIFSKDIQEIELFRVQDTTAYQSFFLRLFGLGTITVISGDERHPRVVLNAIPHALDLREKIRQNVMLLRQRFGVREMDVMQSHLPPPSPF